MSIVLIAVICFLAGGIGGLLVAALCCMAGRDEQ